MCCSEEQCYAKTVMPQASHAGKITCSIAHHGCPSTFTQSSSLALVRPFFEAYESPAEAAAQGAAACSCANGGSDGEMWRKWSDEVRDAPVDGGGSGGVSP